MVDRVRFVFDIPERETNQIRLLSKGRHLTAPEAPVRDYGVQNNSELLVVINESSQAAVKSTMSQGNHDDRREESGLRESNDAVNISTATEELENTSLEDPNRQSVVILGDDKSGKLIKY